MLELNDCTKVVINSLSKGNQKKVLVNRLNYYQNKNFSLF